VARVAAIVLVALIALRLLPALLHAPEPPPVPANVGLPKGKPSAARPTRTKPPRPHRRPLHDAPAATAKIGTGTRHHRKRPPRSHPARPHRSPRPPPTSEGVEPTSPPATELSPPPAPEPVPEPVPAPLPEPPPAPPSVPGDGSQEFAPH